MLPQSWAPLHNTFPIARQASRAWALLTLVGLDWSPGASTRRGASYLVLLQLRLPGLLLRLLGLNQALAVSQLVDAELVLHLRLPLLRDGAVLEPRPRPGARAGGVWVTMVHCLTALRQVSKNLGKSPGK